MLEVESFFLLGGQMADVCFEIRAAMAGHCLILTAVLYVLHVCFAHAVVDRPALCQCRTWIGT